MHALRFRHCLAETLAIPEEETLDDNGISDDVKSFVIRSETKPVLPLGCFGQGTLLSVSSPSCLIQQHTHKLRFMYVCVGAWGGGLWSEEHASLSVSFLVSTGETNTHPSQVQLHRAVRPSLSPLCHSFLFPCHVMSFCCHVRIGKVACISTFVFYIVFRI